LPFGKYGVRRQAKRDAALDAVRRLKKAVSPLRSATAFHNYRKGFCAGGLLLFL